MIIDTHTHYDDSRYDEDREELLARLEAEGVSDIINMGADWKGCEASVNMAANHEHIYAAVGLHPDYVHLLSEEKLEELRLLSRSEKVVAIGEIGLDYADTEMSEEEMVANHELQKHWFCEMLRIAREEQKPVVIHSRDAAEDTLRIMKEHTELAKKEGSFKGGVIHCFSYSPEIAREYLNMGYYLGIGGVLTFKNARRLPEVVEMAPIGRILLETDCPYLAPVPFRGKRNESTYLKYVVEKIAEIKNISKEAVEEQTSLNARRFMNGLSE